MFKKINALLLTTVCIIGAFVLGAEETHAKASLRVKEEVIIQSNVGDGQEYAYQITEIKGEEIHGVPLNKKSKTNCGIFLYKSEVSFDVKVGDKIVVIWGEEEDEFELIDLAIQEENGEHVSATKKRIEALLEQLRKRTVKL